MANKKIIKRNSGPLTYKIPFMEKVKGNTNKYDVGGFLAKFNTNLGNVMGGNKLVGTPAGSAINVLGSTAGQLGGTLIGGGLESDTGGAVTSIGGALGTAAGAVNPLLGGIISAGTGILGGLTTRAFGSKLNNDEINKIKASNLAMNQLQVDSSSNDAVMNQWNSTDFGENFTRGDIGKDGWFSNKARNKYNTLKQEQDAARGRALLALSNGANNADSNLDMSAFSNYAAFGGPLELGSGAIGYKFGNEYLNNQKMSAIAKQRLTSLPNSFQALPEMNTHNAFAEGGWLGTGINEDVATAASFLPVVGTVMDGAEFINDPSWENAGWFLGGLASDIFTGGASRAALKGVKLARRAAKAAKALKVKRLEAALRRGNQSYSTSMRAYRKAEAAESKANKDMLNGIGKFAGYLSVDVLQNHIQQNTKAFGGPINIISNTPMTPFGNRFGNGGSIHINPANRGKFNATKQRTGKSTEELTHSKNALTRKRAIFAQNASHWHDLGGVLQGNGADWSTGMTLINNGGTHEQNPNEGVQMGVDDQGTPNLVEQGEVKWNNYIFSNRMTIKESLLEKVSLPTSLANHTFASAAESLGKESKERPNDPISQKGLNSMLGRLAAIQEIVRQKEQSKQLKQQAQLKNNNKYEGGGPLRDNDSNQSFFRSYYSDNAVDNPLQNNLDSPLLPTIDKTSSNQGLADLRYVPAIGSGLSVLSDALGWTNTPDYSNADLILKAGNNLKNVSYTPIGNYLTYTPFDRNFYTNKLQAQANATRRAIIDQSGGNRVNAVAGMLAADYNAQSKLGDLFRQAEEYNQGLKERVQTFNRGTNQFNSEASLKAQMANQANDRIRYEAAVQAAKVREEEDARIMAQRSANLSNFLQNMGDIGVDAYNRNDRNALIKSGYFGALNTAMLQNSGMSRTDKINYLKSLGWTDEEVKKAGFAYGGKLKIKKRGLTY